MKKFLCLFIALVISIASLQGTVFAQENEKLTLIVELEEDAVLDADELLTDGVEAFLMSDEGEEETNRILKKQTQAFSEIKNNIDHDADEGFHYTMLFNGFSVDTDISGMEKIKAVKGVKNVFISNTYSVPDEFESELTPNLHDSGSLIQSDYSHDNGYNGEGRVIAIIDSEFQTGHEFFQQSPINPHYSKNDIENYINEGNMNSNIKASNVYRNAKIPFAYDYGEGDNDTNSNTGIHGTHVAGIAGGKNGMHPQAYEQFSGIAPEAQLICMKVTDANNVMKDAAILAAIDDAAKFEIDAINLSIGIDYVNQDMYAGQNAQNAMYPGKYYNYDEVISSARNRGIMVSVAAGNTARGFEGNTPTTDNIDYSTSGIPASIPESTSVASSNNAMSFYVWRFALANGSEVAFSEAYMYSGFVNAFADNTFEYADCGNGTVSGFSGVDVAGKVALVKRGADSFVNMAQRAKNKGAVAIIIQNYNDEFLNTVELALPAAIVRQSDSMQMYQVTDKSAVILRTQGCSVETVSSGAISSYSSWGMTEALDLSLDFTAPGANILSSVPDNKYTIMSGTSMAAPHVTGAMALMNQYYETNPFTDDNNGFRDARRVLLLENLIMSTAEIAKNEDAIPESPRRQGAGIMNLRAAMNAQTVIQGPSGDTKLNLKQLSSSTVPISFTVKNLKNETVTYDTVSIDLMTDGYAEQDGVCYTNESVGLTSINDTLPESVTIPANSSVTVSGSIYLDEAQLAANEEIYTNGFYIDGYITLSDSNGDIVKASVPFMGLYGDWYEMQGFDTTLYDEGGSSLSYVDGESSAFAGTGLFSDAGVILGKNNADRTIDGYNNISFSPANMEYLRFGAHSYRSMKSVKYTIENSQGITVYSLNQSEYSKYYLESTKLTAFKTLPEGAYTLTVEGQYYGPDASHTGYDDNLTFPVTIDSSAPSVESISFNDTNTSMTVTSSDNNKVMSALLVYSDKLGYTRSMLLPATDNGQGQSDIVFNISNVADINSAQLSVYDYAYNRNTSLVSEHFENITCKVLGYGDLVSYSCLEMNVINHTSSEINGNLIIVFYNSDGSIITVKMQKEKLAVGDNNLVFNFPIKDNVFSAYTIKAMIWDDNMNPFDTSKLL